MSSRRPRPYRLWFEQLETRMAPAVMFSNSLNWSGYAVVGAHNSISAISASWTVPTVTGSANSYGYSATWVGIDGAASRTVEQVGTEADYAYGQTSYYAWYEMYPAPTFIIDQPVLPGDTITASVAYAAGKGFTVSINSTSWSTPFTQTIKPSTTVARSSAEAVVEAPSQGGILPLANYGSETFSSVNLTQGKSTTGIGTPATGKVEQINMVTRGDQTVQTASPLTGGNSFTVTDNAGQNVTGSGNASGGSTHGARDNNQMIIIVTITVPTLNANLPFVTSPLQVPPITGAAPSTPVLSTATIPPPISVLMDPFVGSGISDALPAVHDNAPGGVVPGGPVQVPPITAPAAPSTPQQSRLDTGLPSANGSYFATDAETALLQDDGTEASTGDGVERTVDLVGAVVLVGLGLGMSSGISLGDREARKKPIAL